MLANLESEMGKRPPKNTSVTSGAITKPAASGPVLKLTDDQARRATGAGAPTLQRRMLNQTFNALKLYAAEDHDEAVQAALAALEAIGPVDGVEGMLATQMVATHEAAMECLRRAMNPEQTFAGRDVNLKHAAKLLQIYARQVEALDKHRGKGQQKITVEHVTVEAGGQAIVGNVQAPVAKNRAAPEVQGALSDQSAAAGNLTDVTGASTKEAKQRVRRREQ